MVVILERSMKLKMRSGAKLRNEEEEGAFRFKSTHRAPNTQDQNIWVAVNVAREDEAEQPQSHTGRPRVGRQAPPCQVWAPVFYKLFMIPSFLGYLGVLVQKREERIEGKRKERSSLR